MGFPCGPLNTIPEAAEHRPGQGARNAGRGRERARQQATISNSPLRLSRTPGRIRGGPPTIGHDTREVLQSLLGLTPAAVDALFESGIAVEGQDIPSELTS